MTRVYSLLKVSVILGADQGSLAFRGEYLQEVMASDNEPTHVLKILRSFLWFFGVKREIYSQLQK